jgi:hypothetical protein
VALSTITLTQNQHTTKFQPDELSGQ